MIDVAELSDEELESEGMKVLFDRLGKRAAYRFTALMTRHKFDYTEWSQHLFEDMTFDELAKDAQAHREEARRQDPQNPNPVLVL